MLAFAGTGVFLALHVGVKVLAGSPPGHQYEFAIIPDVTQQLQPQKTGMTMYETQAFAKPFFEGNGLAGRKLES